MPGPTAPDSWPDRFQHGAIALLFAAIAVVVAWQLLSRMLVPLVIIVVLVGIIRLAVGWSRRDGW